MGDECERVWADIVTMYATAAEKCERIWKERETLVVTSSSTCVSSPLPAPLLEKDSPRYRELEPLSSSRDQEEVHEVNAGGTSSTRLSNHRHFTLSCLCPRWRWSVGRLK